MSDRPPTTPVTAAITASTPARLACDVAYPTLAPAAKSAAASTTIAEGVCFIGRVPTARSAVRVRRPPSGEQIIDRAAGKLKEFPRVRGLRLRREHLCRE